jgi:hypothetical protein
LNVFSYLKCADLMRCSQVSRNWNQLAYDPTYFKRVSFGEWKSKNNCINFIKDFLINFYFFNLKNLKIYFFNFFFLHWLGGSREKNSFGYKDVDYIDDSEEEEFENEAEFVSDLSAFLK